MLLKRIVIICTLPSFLAGCAGLYGSQPPAPVYGGQPKIQKPSGSTQKQTKPPSAAAKETVKTQPIKDFSDVKPEPFSPSEPPPSDPVTLDALEPSAPTPPPPSELTPFQPIEATVRLSPVVTALVSAANQNSNAGDLDSAATSIERAIRIEPRNATLFYKLALLRLKQSKPNLAEDLAKKSALLAATDTTLKKHCWLLIAHAREMQQDFSGAKAARAKADNF
ncbi:tetratricopeptide repeat protein [Methylobacter sp. G7]|uniref:tetratricopeptide repeat protein n=1 Tax=Methylobacter sp. G7 TaxID=3230117 RepID=UPI003D809319